MYFWRIGTSFLMGELARSGGSDSGGRARSDVRIGNRDEFHRRRQDSINHATYARIPCKAYAVEIELRAS